MFEATATAGVLGLGVGGAITAVKNNWSPSASSVTLSSGGTSNRVLKAIAAPVNGAPVVQKALFYGGTLSAYAFTEYYTKMLRGQADSWNAVPAACVAGACIGASATCLATAVYRIGFMGILRV